MNKYPNFDPQKRDQFLKQLQDRGMMKWFGFYLSDHSAAIRKEKRQEKRILAQTYHQQMDFSNIADLISSAFSQNQKVAIEINKTEIKNGEFIPMAPICGYINGRTETGLIVNHQEISYEEIKFISIL